MLACHSLVGLIETREGEKESRRKRERKKGLACWLAGLLDTGLNVALQRTAYSVSDGMGWDGCDP